MPDGQLTPVQFEVMEAIWAAEAAEGRGASVAEIWQVISSQRSVGRTTILNLVDRLEKRGWLTRDDADGTARYRTAVPRDQAAAELAGEFVTDFFGGSASSLMMSLLGSQKLGKDEIARLRQLLDQAGDSGKKPGRK